MNLINAELFTLVDEQREFIGKMQGDFPPAPASPPPVLPARQFSLPAHPACAVRVLLPEGAAEAVYLHIHGGGFMHGDAAMGDVPNSALARQLGFATVSVDYRLAPRHAHPSAVDDCEAAARWLIENASREFGTERLLIGGDSVGASLAVLTLLRLRDRHGAQARFLGANLVVGNYDFSMTPSQRASTPKHFLSPQHLAEMRAAVFSGQPLETLRDPSISALYADLRDMPPALFSVGTADAVLDDSVFMAARWELAGNRAELAVYPQAPHLFMMYPTRMAAAANARVQAFLKGCR